MIPKLIESTLILSSLSTSDKDGALDEILAAAVAEGRLAKKLLAPVRKKMVERERLGSTGIGNGIAVPHVKHAGIERVEMVLARSESGIDYAAVDGRAVHTIFMILAPEVAPDDHLKLLRWVSSLARSADFRRFVMQAEGEAEIRELLREMGPAR